MTKVAKKNEAAVVAPVKKGWRIKQYFINKKIFDATQAELAKAPNQVQLMVKHFATKYVDEASAAQGKVMCADAIEHGGLKTVIDPAVLFAYYRKTMEAFGLTLKA